MTGHDISGGYASEDIKNWYSSHNDKTETLKSALANFTPKRNTDKALAGMIQRVQVE